jgi:hypothetical protein
MAAKRPASQSTEVTPTEADAGGVPPAAVATDPTPAAPDSTSSVPDSTSSAPDTTVAPVAEQPAVVETPATPAAPAQQVVYVEAPKPFVKKGNRGFGILIALLSTVIFAALYAVALIVVELARGASSLDFGFISTLDFYAPVIMFAVGFVLLVLVVNRAGWAAHVIGSLFVALVVFFGGTGLELLLHINTIPSNEVGQDFALVLFSTELIIAALLAREVSLWMGFTVAARGRKVKARNVDARVLYDQEIAAKRAEYEQANARNATGPVEPVVAEPVVAEPVATETPAP